MNTETAEILCKLNTDFYRKQAASFSETRQAPWPGWKKCVEVLRGALFGEVSVFDLACGNLRFEAFLAAALPETKIAFYAVDTCDALIPSQSTVQYQSLDIVDELLKASDLNDSFEAPLCDVSVSFGFMHHVPGHKLREEILSSLIAQCNPGGHVIVSFWQFMKNPDMAEKAQVTHKLALEELGIAPLDENDYVLGWKNLPGAYRYCHSFTETEIDQLVASVADRADLVARFAADGRTGDLNTYVILKTHDMKGLSHDG